MKNRAMLGILATLGSLLASPVFAANEAEMASECIAAFESGDSEKAKRIADDIKEWRYLFNDAVISKAEMCLETVSGEHWKYFSTKGRFLSGEAAMQEQAFIDGAGERRKEQERQSNERRKEQERQNNLLKCKVELARYKLDLVEAELKRTKSARVAEVKWKTADACNEAYEQNPTSTLLNPVCNDIFLSSGTPDTQFAFDYEALMDARIELALAVEAANPTSATPSKSDEYTDVSLDECRALLEN